MLVKYPILKHNSEGRKDFPVWRHGGGPISLLNKPNYSKVILGEIHPVPRARSKIPFFFFFVGIDVNPKWKYYYKYNDVEYYNLLIW